MRICHVNLARGFRGGERQTQLLITALAAKGLQQVLLARADSPLHEKLSGTPGLSCYGLPNTLFGGLLWIRQFAPDIVHAHDARAAQWALLNFLLRRTPYIITRRVPNPIGGNWFTSAVYRNAATVVGLSRAIKHRIQQLVPDREVKVIPSMFASFPIDAQRVDQLRSVYQDRFVIGHIGALVDRHKGQSLLIAAANRLAQKYPNMRFVFVGQGEDEAMLKQLAAETENIEFTGFVTDVGNWIGLFDLFVLPSRNEGLGSTLLDVMQQGKPIIASAVDGILDVIEDGQNGLLVNTSDTGSLAAAIERLYLDSNLRRQLGQAAYESLPRYSPERIAECYHNEYKLIIESGGSALK